MDRKNFLKALGLLPVFNIASAKSAAKHEVSFLTELCKTQRDQEGPFYKPEAPQRMVIETEGTPLKIEGRLLKSDDCETPIADAVIDIWHCDNHGDYDMKGFKCRGQLKTDAQGNYSFNTIFPPPYGNRPRHIHVKVRAQGYKELTTQIYFSGDPNLRNDFARNAEESRVIQLITEKSYKKGSFNIYL